MGGTDVNMIGLPVELEPIGDQEMQDSSPTFAEERIGCRGSHSRSNRTFTIFAAGPRCLRGNRILIANMCNKIINFMISLIIKIFKRLLKMSQNPRKS